MQMATNDQRPRRKRVPINWGLPIFSALLGLVLLAAVWIGGNPLLGLAMLGIMLAFGAIFVGRSGNPWAPLGGVSYLASLLWLRWRR
jgi:hypothetical protein